MGEEPITGEGLLEFGHAGEVVKLELTNGYLVGGRGYKIYNSNYLYTIMQGFSTI